MYMLYKEEDVLSSQYYGKDKWTQQVGDVIDWHIGSNSKWH